ncbi:DUF3151 domain-containing protein [Cellulosimicrobium composti]|uniref:DUF3151 domain-containing protein n=1 Tax=Cellulosimicrobium composti TaxID=2672572 RepID=A0A6N7ZDV9_9MICO|nr:DUF3151 domain-containing protein [Cellulosimicrobium composti]MTG87624.1 DUF3151 family protein [Cellulosimicrobium composti]NDO89502.1 DUF3151 domain-containing protein [Cellulosimicrobium composti]TWG86040.1 uncharacterized protein DUF3151 [Cellulosimicrobium cellulans J34]SME89541.1 Protein of unknown function [Cellulosimicrobium cellulans J1]
MSDTHANLLDGPAPVRLPDDFAHVRDAIAADGDPYEIAARTPASPLAWAHLAEDYLHENGSRGAVTAYAFARTGYHRGLDALRRAGWRGQGPIPADHVPNQGFLRALLALAECAAYLGEVEEAERCEQFLRDSGTSADEVRALR